MKKLLSSIFVCFLFFSFHSICLATPPKKPEPPKPSCGSCTHQYRQLCGEECLQRRDSEELDVLECLDSCIEAQCKEECACSSCRKEQMKPCQKKCEDDEEETCYSKCITDACESDCGKEEGEGERPAPVL